MISAWLLAGLAMQLAQNSPPAKDTARVHGRVLHKAPAGVRKGRALIVGHPGPLSPVILHFHGDTWVPEQSVAGVYSDATIISIYAGGNSDDYKFLCNTPQAFQALLAEAGATANRRPVVLSAFSAGYGAVRTILRHSYKRVDGVLLMDGLHADYIGSRIDPAGLNIFLQFARDAALGRKRMLITHSEVFPGAFASTTETANWLLNQLHLRRARVCTPGPVGMQQISSAHRGKLTILGFAGDTPLDHVDHLHGMATWLDRLDSM
jgi:hypothetical protein